jgi:hypothetical protein
MLVVAAALLAGFLAGRATAGPSYSVARRVYVVQAGDTVWGIAERFADGDDDPRPYADRLIQDNHVTDALIVPGERLVLPG